MTAAGEALRGRRESWLLELPSVRAMADVLAERCRDASWVRTSVASLDRFATMTGNRDLEALLARAKRRPADATVALDTFAAALAPYAKSQVAALAMAPKLWFTLGGVDVAWRPLRADAPTPFHGRASNDDRLVLHALIGSGLGRAELHRVRLGDLGRLAAGGAFVADLDADPLVVRFVQARGSLERITFFTDQARDAIRAELARRVASGASVARDAFLVARAASQRPARLNASLIESGSMTNVELCRTTGRFFREWGLPGAKFDERLAAETRIR